MILQDQIPYDITGPHKLPGIAPLDPADWLHVDEAYAGQMAERAALLSGRRDAVLMLDEAARPAAEELLDMVLEALPTGFKRSGDAVQRPDGQSVTLDRGDPLGTLGHLVQEDFCLLIKDGDEHVLKGAVLCFPANWMLSEKAGRALIGIHRPVDSYDGTMARRVQRLFDGVKPGRPLWRFNALRYDDPSLHQPCYENAPRKIPAQGRFIRSERQCILRLPRTDAVVFSIHTYVVARAGA